MNEKLTLTVAETAELIGISLPIAYELTHRQGFPVVHVGRRLLIPREALSRWLEAQAAIGAQHGV